MRASILTVDDSPSIRTAIRIALADAGYALAEAANGAEGIAKAKAHKFDLILTDFYMPVMDGLIMVQELRKSPDHFGIPIIFLTTESDDNVKQRAKSAGATGWILKPFSADQLLKVIRKVLGQ